MRRQSRNRRTAAIRRKAAKRTVRKAAPQRIKVGGRIYEKVEAKPGRKKAAWGNDPIRIYIADLDAYNEGKLVGEWVDLPMDEDELKAITDKLSQGGRGDTAIHDYEAPFHISEHQSVFDLNEMAEAVEDAYVSWELLGCIMDYGYSGDWRGALAAAEDAMVLEARNETDLAYAWIEAIGDFESAVGNAAERYFDYERFGRDLRLDNYGYDEETEEDMYEDMSDEEVGEDFVDSMGGVGELGKDTIEQYFDYQSYGRDLAFDFFECEGLYISIP